MDTVQVGLYRRSKMTATTLHPIERKVKDDVEPDATSRDFAVPPDKRW
jgi:hypothetical protein